MNRKSIKKRLRRWLGRTLGPFLLGRRFWAGPIYTELGRRGCLIIKDCGDHSILVDPGDQVIGQAILRKGTWNRAEQDALIGFLAGRGALSGKVFLDVGANIGTQTIYALLTGRFERAVSVEAFPENAERIAFNLKLNDMAERVHLVRGAAGARSGTASLHTDTWNSGGHSLKPIRSGPEVGGIPVLRIADILLEAGVAPEEVGFVWVDVEGSEADVLAGMETLLVAAPPLMIEYSPQFLTAGERTSLLEMLAAHYPVFYRTTDIVGGLPPAPLDLQTLSRIEHQTDLLCLKAES